MVLLALGETYRRSVRYYWYLRSLPSGRQCLCAQPLCDIQRSKEPSGIVELRKSEDVERLYEMGMEYLHKSLSEQ